MRRLKFVVDKQIIKPDPDCDFSGLVPGTEGYLEAEFVFSSEWNGCKKVAGFYSMLGREYKPQIIELKSFANVCQIPAEALEAKSFKIRVIGKKDGFKLTTNKLTVSQKGSVK